MNLPVTSFVRTTCEKEYGRYKKGKRLGKGVSAIVYELCDDKECPYVLKIDYTGRSDSFFTTMMLQKYAHDLFGIAPKVHDVWFCFNKRQISGRQTLGFAVMDRMDGSLMDLDLANISKEIRKNLAKQLKRLVSNLNSMGIQHGDIWEVNVLFKKLPTGEIKLYLADFGNAEFTDNFDADDDMVKTVARRLIRDEKMARPVWLSKDPRTDEEILQGVQWESESTQSI
jgi:RIO-like serine/threonine protein kinase